MNPELDSARARIGALRIVPEADVAEQPGQQRAMNRQIAFGPARVDRRTLPSKLPYRTEELRMDVAPLSHSPDRHEMLATDLGQLPVRRSALRLVVERPQFQEGDKI